MHVVAAGVEMTVASTPRRSDRAWPRPEPWMAWVVWVLVVAITAGNVMIRIATRAGPFGEPWGVALLVDVAFLMLPTVGLIIAVRRPEVVFGWLLLAAAFAFGAGDLGHSYATQALTNRRRLQAMVDRRFDRRRYNAAKTIERFSTRLRDEIDLDILTAELLTVVHETVQPTAASLWLRPSGQGPRRNSI
jgi:hypothetical protein